MYYKKANIFGEKKKYLFVFKIFNIQIQIIIKFGTAKPINNIQKIKIPPTPHKFRSLNTYLLTSLHQKRC